MSLEIREIRIVKKPLIVFGIIFGGMAIFAFSLCFTHPDGGTFPLGILWTIIAIYTMWWFSSHRIKLTESELGYCRPFRAPQTIPRADIGSLDIESGVHKSPSKGPLPLYRLMVRQKQGNEEGELAINIKLFPEEDIRELMSISNKRRDR